MATSRAQVPKPPLGACPSLFHTSLRPGLQSHAGKAGKKPWSREKTGARAAHLLFALVHPLFVCRLAHESSRFTRYGLPAELRTTPARSLSNGYAPSLPALGTVKALTGAAGIRWRISSALFRVAAASEVFAACRWLHRIRRIIGKASLPLPPGVERRPLFTPGARQQGPFTRTWLLTPSHRV